MPSPSTLSEIPLLVLSCDRYADIWPPFFNLFWRRWPDCPFPVHLGSNHRSWSDPRVGNIPIGDDPSWATGVQRMLDRLQAEWVILFLEDFLLKSQVSTPDVLRIVQAATRAGVATARLSPLPPPSRLPEVTVPDVPFMGVVPAGTPYRVSAQPALWRVDALRRYLVPGFTAWEFELLGSQMSDFLPDEFWGPFAATIDYDHGVEKGRWKPEGLRICAAAGVAVDTAARPAFSSAQLEAHHQTGVAASSESAAKLWTIDEFSRGRRRAGVGRALQLLARRPSSMQLWAIMACGLAGPGALRWLRREHLKRRVRQALRREAVAPSIAERYLALR